MMGKYDFLFSTPQNSYLDQALPPISRNPVLARPTVPSASMANRPQLSNEMMAALTGRTMNRPMSLPARSPVRMAQSNSPIPLPTSQPSQYTGALPISKPMKPFTPLPAAAGTAQMMRPNQPSYIPASPEQAAPSGGFLGGLLGDGFDDPRSQGILAASAALLEAGAPVVGGVAPSLGQALGQGLRAGMGAYGAAKKGITNAEDDAINREYKQTMTDQMKAKMNQPSRTSIAGGAATLIEYPDGTSEIVKNDGIQDLILDQKRAAADIEIDTARRKKELTDPKNLTVAEKEYDKETARNLQAKQSAIADWPVTKDYLIKIKSQIDGGSFTGLLGETNATAAMLSDDEQQARNFLEGLAQKLAKARNGARVTDADVNNARRSIPNLYLSKENFAATADRLIQEFELAAAQANAEANFLEANGTFKGYEPPEIINGVIVTKK
jgi:hypothetical protein